MIDLSSVRLDLYGGRSLCIFRPAILVLYHGIDVFDSVWPYTPEQYHPDLFADLPTGHPQRNQRGKGVLSFLMHVHSGEDAPC